MSNPDNNTAATDAVKALHLFLHGAESSIASTPERLVKELNNAGIDITKMAAEVRKRISQAQNRDRLADIQKAGRVKPAFRQGSN